MNETVSSYESNGLFYTTNNLSIHIFLSADAFHARFTKERKVIERKVER